MMEIEAAVAMCKCKESHKVFSVRYEKVKPDLWKYTWAFPVREDTAKREGYDSTLIKGMIIPEENYPGCPYCGSKYFVVCSCGKLNCKTPKPNSNEFTCEWCGMTGILGVYEGAGIQSGGDR